jgi:hypothetical protein
VVFIEWTQARHGKSQELKSNLWEISGVLSFQKPDSMLLPYSYGVVENLSEGQFGIVLMPPTHIRMHIPPLSQIPRGEISCRRMPSTLETLISVAIGSPAHGSGAGEPVDLGTRFRIARKLVDAIHIMHTVNLLHKLSSLHPSE